MTNPGEITWCHPNLVNEGPKSLSERQSRETLRRLFDGRTPRSEIFQLSWTKAQPVANDNVLGISHARETRCSPIDTSWQVFFDNRMEAMSVDFIDLDGNGIEEIRIGYALGAGQRPTIWRCYDAFGSSVAQGCAP